MTQNRCASETPSGSASAGEVEEYTFGATPTAISLAAISGAPLSAPWLPGAALLALLGLLSAAALLTRRRMAPDRAAL